MTSKLMTLAFAGALALSVMATNAMARNKGNAHSPGSTAVGTSKRLPPQLVKRQVAGSAISSHSVNGKKK